MAIYIATYHERMADGTERNPDYYIKADNKRAARSLAKNLEECSRFRTIELVSLEREVKK